MRTLLGKILSLGLLGLPGIAFANGAGVIGSMHYSIYDQDQMNAICFKVGGASLAFIGNGSEKHKAVSGLLIGAFMAQKTISYESSTDPLSPTPCQAWDMTGPVYKILSLQFAP
jgi:hypothetical protein